MPDLTVAALDVSEPAVAEAVVAIQRRSYAIEAALIGFDGIPPLAETAADLRAAPLQFLGVHVGGALAGIVGYSWADGGRTLDIDRLAVDPDYLRRGLASALLRALPPAALTVVSTGTANEPALALYRRHGFTPTGTREISPGVTVTLLRREGAERA